MRTLITHMEDGLVLNRGVEASQRPIIFGYWRGLCHMLGVESDAAPDAMEYVATLFQDHGLAPPSTAACVMASSAGASLPHSIAAACIAFGGDHHGGSIMAAATMLLSGEIPPKPVPGFGHPVHKTKEDKRVNMLIDSPYKKRGAYVSRLMDIGSSLGLRPNISGAGAAYLLDAGVPARFVQLPYIIGRIAGWAAHWSAEQDEPKKSSAGIEWEKAFSGSVRVGNLVE